MKNKITKQKGRPEQVVKLLNLFFYIKTDRSRVRYRLPDDAKRMAKSVRQSQKSWRLSSIK